MHATIPKGNVGGFESTVLQRNLKEWHGRGEGGRGGGGGSHGHIFVCAKRKQSTQTLHKFECRAPKGRGASENDRSASRNQTGNGLWEYLMYTQARLQVAVL